jgi:hypothetical protein
VALSWPRSGFREVELAPYLLCERIEINQLILLWIRQTDNNQQIRIKVAVIKCSAGSGVVRSFAEEYNVRRSAFDQHLDTSQYCATFDLEAVCTFVACSTPTSSSAHLTSFFSTSSPTCICLQSLPTNLGSPAFEGGG